MGAVILSGWIPTLTCAEQKVRLGVVLKALDSEFWMTVKAGAEKAAEELNIDVTVLAPPSENDVERQITIIEDLVSQKVNGLAVAANDVAAVVPPLERGFRKNIPFVTLDSDAMTDKKAAFIGTDNFRGGQLAAEYIIGKLGGKGKVALITGVPGQRTHMLRRDGFLDGLKKAKGLRLVATQPANSDRFLALNVLENILQAHPDMNAVFVTNSTMAMGAAQAIKARRKTGKIILVGFDTSQEVLLAIEKGEISAAIAQSPFKMGYLGVKELYRAVRGQKPTSKKVDTGTEVVTLKNYRNYLKKEGLEPEFFTRIPVAGACHTQGLEITSKWFYITCQDTKNHKALLYRIDRKDPEKSRKVDLTRGDQEHPSGIHLDKNCLWVSVAVPRKENASSTVMCVDPDSLKVKSQFSVKDHIGGVFSSGKRIYGLNWDTRHIYTWDIKGKQLDKTKSPFGVAYQDCDISSDKLLICGGYRYEKKKEKTAFVDVIELDAGKSPSNWKKRSSWGFSKSKLPKGLVYTNEGIACEAGNIYLIPGDFPNPRIYRVKAGH